MSRFANNALLGGGIRVRVRVWIREQRKIKRRSKALTKPLLAILDISQLFREGGGGGPSALVSVMQHL